MQAISKEFGQRWRRIMLIIKSLHRKKTGTPAVKQTTPVRQVRNHKPVIDRHIKRMVNNFFRQAFNEN